MWAGRCSRCILSRTQSAMFAGERGSVSEREVTTLHPIHTLRYFAMPFYFALPRASTFSGSTQRGTLVKSDYIRTQPSQLLYQLTSAYMYPMKSILYSLLGNVALAIGKSISEKRPMTIDFEKAPFISAPYKLRECTYLTLPKIEVAFTGRPRPADIQEIESKGGDTIKIRGQVKDIHSVKVQSYDALDPMISFENIDAGYRPTEGAISVPQVLSLAHIITRIHVVSGVLAAIGSFTGGHFDFNLYSSTENIVETQNAEEMELEEGRYLCFLVRHPDFVLSIRKTTAD